MAGSVVVKDVAALEQFASRLASSRSQLEQVARELSSALNAVSSSWQDPQRDKCAREVEMLVKSMRSFAEAADKQVSYCKGLAARIKSMP